MSDVAKEYDDSDESLPDIFAVRPAPLTTSINKGDIVWAKFKNLYWPALVRSVYKKEKKISVWYTDDPGKTFKLPLKNVCSFRDRDMRIKIQKEVREAGCIQEHEGLTAHAVRYLERKAEGYVDDPMKFFDQTYPFYLVEEFKRKNPDADVSSIKIPPLYISHGQKSTRKRVNVHKASSSTVESNIESADSDSESDAEDVPEDILAKVTQKIPPTPREDKNINKIVKFIKSGKADGYLEKVLTKCIPSEHRDVYEREIKSNKKCVDRPTFYGPIEDDEKLRELIFYLLPLYDKTDTQSSKHNLRNTQRSKRNLSRKCKSKQPSIDNKSEYVASVWLPEAIIYAMSNVYKVSLSDARELFLKKSGFESKDFESIFASLDSEAGTSYCEGVQKVTNEDSNNAKVCSSSKKIRVDRVVK